MPVGYVDALALSFGERPFTVEEFRLRIGSLRPAQTLSELKTRGVVSRVGRGRYRLLRPEERPDMRSSEWNRVRSELLSSGLPMGWTGPDAVALWTGGKYTVSPTVYMKEFHIEVPASVLTAWMRYLRARRISTNPRRRIGAVVRITARTHTRSSVHRGEPVIPRNETLKLIRSHRGLYGGADKLLERQR